MAEPRYAFELQPPRGVDWFYRLAVAAGFARKPASRSRVVVDGERDMLPQHRERHEPTPEEIAAECARIRDGWGDEERQKRAGAYRRISAGLATGRISD